MLKKLIQLQKFQNQFFSNKSLSANTPLFFFSDLTGYSIYKDYQATLNQSDISYNKLGHNKFYEIYLYHKNDGTQDQFQLQLKWGRVGSRATEKYIGPSSNEDYMIREFQSLFKKKTKNDWKKRDNFEPKKGKYTLIQVDTKNSQKKQELANKNMDDVKKKIKENKSKLQKGVKNLMKMIYNFDNINKELKKMNFNIEKAPLGKLQDQQLEKGYNILKEIETIISKDKSQISQQELDELVELTNQFYTNIPQDFGRKRPPLINDKDMFDKQIDLLNTLRDIEETNKQLEELLKKQNDDQDATNPLDTFYDLLKIDLKPIDPSEKIYQQIAEVLQESHGHTHSYYKLEIMDLFEIEREGEKERFEKSNDIENHRLLWHGSRTSNYPGILSKGLRIAPPEAPMTGYMFGKGVYFADIPSKSANYCRVNAGSREGGIMILSQVALGQMKKVYQSEYFTKAPDGYQSVKANGENIPDSKNFIKLDIKNNKKEPVIFPGGKPIANSTGKNSYYSLLYNEYIVYDESQIQMKYIIRVKFNKA